VIAISPALERGYGPVEFAGTVIAISPAIETRKRPAKLD
jgi:hypothetical protein